MDLFLLRHGIAEHPKPGESDSARALTPEGRRKLRSVLEVARGAGVQPSLILSSPLKRAIETAEIADEVLGYRGKILKTKVLQPDSNAQDVWQELRGHRAEPALLLAGHEPLFSSLAAYLLGDSSIRVDFKKGALLKLSVDSFPPIPRAVLEWYLTPKLALGR
ncbi:MAG: SixA phosphatase family protein [Bryobacteraceae bacterium]